MRNSGYNVATWNLRERNVQMLDSQLLANGVPLRFCHFTKATHIGGYALQRMLKAPGIFEELFYSYVARLQERSIMLKGLSKKWEYGCYEDGSEILGVTRKQFRNLNNRFQYENPFQDRQFIESLLI